MVYEEGKYYPMMHVDLGSRENIKARYEAFGTEEREMFFCYGEHLLNEKNGVLQQYLKEQIRQYEAILNGLANQPQTEALLARSEEIQQKLARAKKAAAYQKEK